MPSLFVQRSIEINASPSVVWDILTRREFTSQWAPEFSNGSPFYIESDWQTGSQVQWKDGEGRVIVEGRVTAHEPLKLLRFTVFDVRITDRPPVSEKDGITFRLWEKNGRTVLDLMQGDFSVMPDGAGHHEASAKVWDKVLPRIKTLAEAA